MLSVTADLAIQMGTGLLFHDNIHKHPESNSVTEKDKHLVKTILIWASDKVITGPHQSFSEV